MLSISILTILNYIFHRILKVSSSDSSLSFGNASQFQASQGIYTLYPFSILYTPGSTAVVNFTSTAIAWVFQRTDLSFGPQLAFGKYLRQCLRGEKRTDTSACYACTSGSYSTYDYSNASYTGTVACQTCPPNAYCQGYYLVGPAVGYWKYDSYSNSFFSCYNGEACLGANVSNGTGLDCREQANIDPGFCFTGWCAEGYQGILCEDCADGWAQSSPVKRTCVQCSNNPGYYVKRYLFFSFI